MNNIYKVIWSKAKNCYVVASEIARSHTKSATGSGKIGGVTRRSLLASLMALSLLCGGLGVASAANGTVHVAESTPGTAEVYTTEKVDTLLNEYGKKTDVENNRNSITTLQTTTTDQGKKITENATNIANNKTAIEKKIDTETANATYATKDALNNLTTTVNGKANEADVNAKLANKADRTYVDTEVGKKANKATTLAGYDIGDAYTKAEVDTAVANAVTTAGNNVNAKLADYAKTADVNNALKGKADKAITLAGYGITDAYTKSDVDKRLNEKADKTDLTKAQTAIDGLNAKTTKITYDASNGTSVDGVTFNAGAVTGVTSINGTKIGVQESGEYIHQDNSIWGNMKKVDTQVKTNADAIAQEKKDREKAIGSLTEDKNYIKKDKNVSDNLVELDKQAKTNADNIQTNADNIKNNKDEIARVNGELVKTNDYFNSELSKTNDYFNSELGNTNNHFNTELGKTNAALQATNKRTAGIGRTDTGVEAGNQTVIENKVYFDQNGNVSGVKDLQTDTIHATGKITSEGLDAKAGDIKTTGKVSAGDISTGTLETTGNATIGGDLTVNGKLNVDEISMKNDGLDLNGDQHHSATTITADGISNNAKVTDKNGVTTESKFTHDKEGSTTYAYKGDVADWKESTSNVTADGVENVAKDSKDNNNTFTQTSTDTKNILKDKDGNTSTTRQDSKGIYGYAKDKDGNKSYTKQEGNRIAESVIGQDGKQTKSEMTSTDITNTAKDGIITNTAKNVTNEGTESVTNKVGANEVKVSTNGVDITAEAGKKITESVGTASRVVENDKITDKAADSTVTTENGKGTTFGKKGSTGTTNIYGDSIRTGKINAEDTTTAKLTAGAAAGADGGRLTVDASDGVKGSYKSGNYTSKSYILANTLTSGVDNGKKPTDTDFVGSRTDHYMDGNKAKLDETVKDADGSNVTNKTSTGTATTITDGNGNISATIQNAKNLAGSVTNGTETGVSGIHANDDGSVSIDSAVAGGSSISTINQKKDSITSQVTDGTTITKTEQGTKDITNTATAGTITNDAKDIVNKAQDTITNTAGTSITNQVKDSKVTTDVDGTTFENKTAAVSDGGTTTTKINGNHINTGRVDANELGVSDKDEHGNTADLSVEAGKGVKASAGNGTTTGSLDVKADEVSSSVKDASGKGSTFKQRIDAIMMESKNVSIKAEEKLTNEAKVITNKASEVINNEAVNINNTATGIITSKASEIKNQADKLISNKVGENTWENMENGKITTSIKDGAKQNLTQSDAAGTTQSTVDGGKSTVTIQNADGLTDVVTNGKNTSIQNQTASAIQAAVKDQAGNENASVANATTSANTITNGTKANTVISTADGTSFINSEAAAPVGDGTEVKTTIKGNTITTGKVTMDYAEVMKDLGVRGNANITGKTTTGSLEVTGTSTLKGDVTMESNATVTKDLSVGGTTTTKTLNVTENATVGGTLDVTQKATFHDDVDIKKNLSVVGDVTANSYKVGDKTYIDKNGIHANGQKITDVADGSISEGSKDAVNGGQLYTVKNDLEGKVNKVGANAAAMANLHPMEFDPDSKWNIAAAIGNYGSETAAALGAFYRPNDNVMVNLSTAFGTGENMVGGGVSVRLGKGGNKLSREESNALKAQVADLTARMDALLSVLNPNMSKDFPDVPENHWAYEAVSRLAGNDIVQGYPDGEFHGERTMTRYEMAEIIYNALSRGAEAEKELVEEFKPELQAMAASEKATAERAEG